MVSSLVHPFTLSATTTLSFDEAVAATRAALAEENFGVLCEIDVKAVLEEKLGIERDPYLILGACNPAFASQVLATDPDFGALLPCNVVVAVVDGLTTVFAVDPDRLLRLGGDPALEPVAHEVARRLQRVVDVVGASL